MLGLQGNTGMHVPEQPHVGSYCYLVLGCGHWPELEALEGPAGLIDPSLLGLLALKIPSIQGLHRGPLSHLPPGAHWDPAALETLSSLRGGNSQSDQ
ncbi:hypothetical protein EYF80_036865 [Liparis tanakae]|uniref:Uncharacterized protein n=1 Tax=Liparis tanakae TaxID=230148 RepID=A0A4Z2GH92_9TELE|nr:hypothetical protein EYF80_036865 [Liparis tanakae]